MVQRVLNIKPSSVPCYAERTEEKWEAFCPHFDLAVQGESFLEVQDKLEAQIILVMEALESDKSLRVAKMPFIPHMKLKLRHFFSWLGTGSLLWMARPRRHPPSGIEEDWRRVGEDLRSALQGGRTYDR